MVEYLNNWLDNAENLNKNPLSNVNSAAANAQVARRLTANQKPKHQHQFTIPVEWIYKVTTTGSKVTPLFTEKKIVTKLRCPCGTEIER
jgi:hypothetical protein